MSFAVVSTLGLDLERRCSDLIMTIMHTILVNESLSLRSTWSDGCELLRCSSFPVYQGRVFELVCEQYAVDQAEQVGSKKAMAYKEGAEMTMTVVA